MKIDGISPVEAQLPVDSVAVRVSSPWASQYRYSGCGGRHDLVPFRQ